MNGSPVPDARICFDFSDTLLTDSEGKVLFDLPEEDGIYKVSFIKDEFISSAFEVEIMAGGIFENRFSVSPKIPFGSIRIVLEWNKKPADLDAHFVKKGEYPVTGSAAANGLDYLDPVAGPQHAGIEAAARDNFLVDLQCEALARQPEILQQCACTVVFGDFPVGAVEDDMHVLASRKMKRGGILTYSRGRRSQRREITSSWR